MNAACSFIVISYNLCVYVLVFLWCSLVCRSEQAKEEACYHAGPPWKWKVDPCKVHTVYTFEIFYGRHTYAKVWCTCRCGCLCDSHGTWCGASPTQAHGVSSKHVAVYELIGNTYLLGSVELSALGGTIVQSTVCRFYCT